MASVLERLTNKICEDILEQPGRDITPGESIIRSGLIDSFSLVDLSIMIENEFGVLIDDSELNSDTFDTLEQLAALIESRQ
ncbi:MAG: acyl carrier protein [Anaerolineae bacterium]|nr:acyl carrier protein [Anaerolineae bacterium]